MFYRHLRYRCMGFAMRDSWVNIWGVLLVLGVSLGISQGCDDASHAAATSGRTQTVQQVEVDDPLPPRPPQRTYPPVAVNPPHARLDRSPWLEAGESSVAIPVPAMPDTSNAAGASDAKKTLPAGVVPWHQAPQFMDQQVTVQGRIVDTGRTRDDQIHFLNFVSNDRESFYVAIFAEAMADLGGDPADSLLHKTVRITGTVTTHQSRPQIQVRDARQIEVVE